MANLMRLPSEVRALIIDLVIFSPRLVPSAPAPETKRKRAASDYDSRSWGSALQPRASYGPDLDYTANSTGLSLTSHQVRSETADRLSRRPVAYELDVVLVNEQYLDPTWNLIPSVSRHVDKITATFWPWGCAKKRRTAFSGGDGGPPSIDWQLYSLLERFLWLGASPLRSPQAPLPRSKEYSIQLLEINVVAPALLAEDCKLIDYDAYMEWRDDHFRDSADMADRCTMHPEYLARHIVLCIRKLLNMSYHTAWYGGIWYDSVGTITVNVDGKLLEKFALGEMLADFPLDGPYECFRKQRQAKFEDWRRYALRKRRERGLPYRMPTVPSNGDAEDDLSDQRYPG